MKNQTYLSSAFAVLLLMPGLACAQNAVVPMQTARAGLLMSTDFSAPAWTQVAATVSGGAKAQVALENAGTIDTYKGTPSGALALSADFSGATTGARAAISSGVLSWKNAETNLGKITLGFEAWQGEVHPIRVVISSLDAAGKTTGSRVGTLIPPVANAWYRFSLDFDKTQKLSGVFDPKSPRISLSFEFSDADGTVSRAAQTLRIDNVSLSVPTLYVSTTGQDTNDGKTERTALKSLGKAVELAQPGDTISLLDGTHTDAEINISKSGSPAAYITVRANPGANPELRSTGWNLFRFIQSASYWELRGLTLRGNRATLNLAEATADGVLKEKDGKTYHGDARFNANAISIQENSLNQTARPHHFRFIGNTVTDFPGGGISAIGCDYVTIENNTVRDNCHFMRYGGSGISVFRSWDFDDFKGHKMFVIGNTASGNRTFVPWAAVGHISDGNGIIVDDNINSQGGASKIPYEGRTLVQNNLSFGNGGSGVHAYASRFVDIVNNTAYFNAQSPELNWSPIFAGGKCDDVRIINNIMVAPPGKPLDFSVSSSSKRIVYANNLYFGAGNNAVKSGGGLGTEAGGTTAQNATNVNANPKFVNPSLDPKVADFRLAAGSPGLGAADLSLPIVPLQGLGGVRRVPGAAPDLGAFEMPQNNDLKTLAAIPLAEKVAVRTTGKLIENGDFALQKASWKFNSHGEQPLQAEIVAGPKPGTSALKVTVVPEAGLKNWSVDAAQPFSRVVTPGEKITVRFWARSPQSNSIAAMIQQVEAPHGGGFYKQLQLSPDWKSYEASGVATQGFEAGEGSIKFFFSLAPGEIEIADVQVIGAP